MTKKQMLLALMDLSSVGVMAGLLMLAGSPWWLYGATLAFGAVQTYVTAKI